MFNFCNSETNSTCCCSLAKYASGSADRLRWSRWTYCSRKWFCIPMWLELEYISPCIVETPSGPCPKSISNPSIWHFVLNCDSSKPCTWQSRNLANCDQFPGTNPTSKTVFISGLKSSNWLSKWYNFACDAILERFIRSARVGFLPGTFMSPTTAPRA